MTMTRKKKINKKTHKRKKKERSKERKEVTNKYRVDQNDEKKILILKIDKVSYGRFQIALIKLKC